MQQFPEAPDFAGEDYMGEQIILCLCRENRRTSCFEDRQPERTFLCDRPLGSIALALRHATGRDKIAEAERKHATIVTQARRAAKALPEPPSPPRASVGEQCHQPPPLFCVPLSFLHQFIDSPVGDRQLLA